MQFKNLCVVRALILSVSFVILSCSSDDNPVNPGNGGGDPKPNPDGVLLEGQPADTAVNATIDLPSAPAPAAERVGDFLSTRLDAFIAPGATVEEVNNALESVGATIVGMKENLPVASLKVPPLIDATAAQQLADSLEATGAFAAVWPAYQMTPSRLDLPGGAANDQLEHLFAYRMPQAWNARYGLTDDLPDVYIVDEFSGFEVPDDLDALVILPNDLLDLTLSDENHGVGTAGVMGADFDSDGITGVFPNRAPKELDMYGVIANGYSALALIMGFDVFIPDTGKFIVNISLTYSESQSDTNETLFIRALTALTWRSFAHEYSDRALFIGSAGNRGQVAGVDPGLESPLATNLSYPNLLSIPGLSASDSSDIIRFTELFEANTPGSTEPFSDNVTLVGAADNSMQPLATTPGTWPVLLPAQNIPAACLNTEAGCTDEMRTVTGSSYATAQFTGLAAYLWGLFPSLEPGDVGFYLDWNPIIEQKPLDAFEVVLDIEALYPQLNYPARKALLDITGPGLAEADGQFNEDDLSIWKGLFAVVGDSGSFEEYGRGDLNGNGWVSGTGSDGAPFDLNADRDENDNVASPLGYYDENNVSDVDCLCFYAYSPLYGGNVTSRDSLMWSLCGSEYIIALMTQDTYVTPGDSTVLVVGVGRLLGDGNDTLWIPNAEVSLIGSQVTLQTYLGTTDGYGQFNTWMTLDPGADSGFVIVSGLFNGEVLATDTISIYALAEGLQLELICEEDLKISAAPIDIYCAVMFDSRTYYFVKATTSGPNPSPIEGVQITANVTGGTVDPTSGQTDANGLMLLRFEADSTSHNFLVHISALAPGSQIAELNQTIDRIWEGHYITSYDNWLVWCSSEAEPEFPDSLEADSLITNGDRRMYLSYKSYNDSITIAGHYGQGLWTYPNTLFKGTISGNVMSGTSYFYDAVTNVETEKGTFTATINQGILEIRWTWGECGAQAGTSMGKFRGRLRQY